MSSLRDRATVRVPRLGVIAVLALFSLALAGTALGLIPTPERVARAVAKTNAASSRDQALQLDIVMRIGTGGDPVATGELVTHPSGLARIELFSEKGFSERHILQGSEHMAARNGRELSRPRAFLPPLFLLQAVSGVSFEAALRAFGVRTEAIGVAPCGEGDCFVVGDPRLAPPVFVEARLGASDGESVDADFVAGGELEGDASVAEAIAPDADLPVVWIDNVSFDLRRIQSAGGVRVTLGPDIVFEQKVRLPSWIEIHEPRQLPVRFDIKRAAPVNAPAQAFAREWLFGSPGEEAPGED